MAVLTIMAASKKQGTGEVLGTGITDSWLRLKHALDICLLNGEMQVTSDKRLRARSLAEAWPTEFEFVHRTEIREKLLARAAEGSQPIGAITDELMTEFPSIATDMSQRRRFGLFVAAVLRDEGFVVRRPNVRMRNKLFSSGAVFRREELSVATDLLRRIVASLTTDEAEHALDLLLSRFPNLRSRARR